VAEPAFWGRLGDVKLHRLQLEEGPLALDAAYVASNHPDISGPLMLKPPAAVAPPPSPAEAEGGPPAGPRRGCRAAGQLFCLNTLERLGAFDREAAARNSADAVWAAIQSGAAESDPALLQPFLVLAYADLKRYRFHHTLGFPALQPPAPFALTRPTAPLDAYDGLTAAQGEAVLAVCRAHAAGAAAPPPPLWLLSTAPGGSDPRAHGLGEWSAVTDAGRNVFLAFVDPSNSAQHPGWPLRNALLLAAARWGAPPELRVLCLRTRRARLEPAACLVLHVALPPLPPGFRPAVAAGWEAAPPRVADLGPSMDPLQLAASAVDLNLQLMRWRAAPTLDLAAVGAARCLLLGAGTLGCSVARALLGWGVRRLTFVDDAAVAFSNPVRQSLYSFQDCLEGGRPKAAAAADAVRRIFPGAQAAGAALTVPMPGHPPQSAAAAEGVLAAARALHDLVDAHDVVFLLLDTREARWLPTLLAAAAGKLAVTAALGFDGFVVMRHGEGVAAAEGREAEAEAVAGEEGAPISGGGAAARLGCYFCSDVVAPANSTSNRALDQQCTVARPGLSGVAGSLAAELAAATMAHPRGAAAPAAGTPAAAAAAAARLAAGEEPPPLGDPPHMVRGQLTGFSQVCLSGQAFARCPACSPAAVRAYRAGGAAFVLRAVSEPQYLQDVTGLTQLHEEAEAALAEAEAAAAAGPGGGGGGEGDDWEEL
jgi:ubiquitin-like modifier-activating enzyme ATG7